MNDTLEISLLRVFLFIIFVGFIIIFNIIVKRGKAKAIIWFMIVYIFTLIKPIIESLKKMNENSYSNFKRHLGMEILHDICEKHYIL